MNTQDMNTIIRCVVCSLYDDKTFAANLLARRNIKPLHNSSREFRHIRRSHRVVIDRCLHVLRPMKENGHLDHADVLYSQRQGSSGSIDIISDVVQSELLPHNQPPPIRRTSTGYFGISPNDEVLCAFKSYEL